MWMYLCLSSYSPGLCSFYSLADNTAVLTSSSSHHFGQALHTFFFLQRASRTLGYGTLTPRRRDRWRKRVNMEWREEQEAMKETCSGSRKRRHDLMKNILTINYENNEKYLNYQHTPYTLIFLFENIHILLAPISL